MFLPFETEAWTKSQLGKYLTLKTLYSKESLPICSHQPYFTSKAKLNCFNCLKPIPPWAFEAQSLSQLIQAIFFLSLHWPHQKLLIRLVSSSNNELGILKQLIEYVGIVWATALIKISLPAFDRSFSFHPASFFWSVSLWFLWKCSSYSFQPAKAV